jgi:hypothetical protein
VDVAEGGLEPPAVWRGWAVGGGHHPAGVGVRGEGVRVERDGVGVAEGGEQVDGDGAEDGQRRVRAGHGDTPITERKDIGRQ